MKCQILFSGKNRKNISKCHLLKFLPGMQGVKMLNKILTDNILVSFLLSCAFQYILVSKIRYQLLVTPPVETPMSMHPFYINGVCVDFYYQLSREKTTCKIKQLLTSEVLDMTLISTTGCQY